MARISPKTSSSESILYVLDSRRLTLNTPDEVNSKMFIFDHVFTAETTQSQIFYRVGTKLV